MRKNTKKCVFYPIFIAFLVAFIVNMYYNYIITIEGGDPKPQRESHMIHKALNRLLVENNMSGYQFTKLSGIPKGQVYRYLNGEATPRQKTLKAIANFFEVEISELFK